MTFSQKIITLRRSKGFSQEKLAEMLDVSRQTISKWESQISLPDASKLLKISEIFNISIDLLLKDELEIPNTINKENNSNIPLNQLNTVFCTNCGKENNADSKFCGYCGQPFTCFIKSNNNTPLTKEDMDMAYYRATLQIQQKTLQIQKQELKELQENNLQKKSFTDNNKIKDSDIVRCPICGSTSIAIESHKKGYGIIKGLSGAAIAGPVGLIAGMVGSNKLKTKRICLKCKHRF